MKAKSDGNSITSRVPKNKNQVEIMFDKSALMSFEQSLQLSTSDRGGIISMGKRENEKYHHNESSYQSLRLSESLSPSRKHLPFEKTAEALRISDTDSMEQAKIKTKALNTLEAARKLFEEIDEGKRSRTIGNSNSRLIEGSDTSKRN
mmetsp:Transcript_50828/g.61250  ORF Transcript_50828/g.61250 Transcript_50828/m.61250 type:complete len:148 (+) Transcript_50828:534-977(+)